ncbi:MAG: 2,3-bisphosphoglycerate-independent phosphoglycerate mutase [Erysipelotrichales bacterium]|nr:2,3-bisphosphoglycerate-independent phosphoglycerate mutase [Erysipelotrichales bacterium]
MKKVIMLILDGFGINESEYGNAIKQTSMDCYNELFNEYPHAILEASGEDVGLPDGQFGNSEVGHLTIGAGKVLKHDITLCNEVLGSTLIEHDEKMIQFLNTIKQNKGSLHLMGLVSDGGVHSDIKYMKNLMNHLKAMGVRKVYFHAITDGRDTGVKTSINYLKDLENTMKEVGIGSISSICGRYYAMDRDNKWERTKVYTDMLLQGKGLKVKSFDKAIEACYKRDITDEFLIPILLDEKAIINDNDGLLWLNFRGDRARQILNALADESFDGYRIKKPKNFNVLTLVDVPNTNGLDHLLENEQEVYSLGNYLSDLGMRQARIAETEKYAHVTFFFNGGGETKLKGCDNFLVPSPRVSTYDKTPEMSIREVTKQAVKCLEKDYDFILVNFANPDMLGHTGNIEATKEGLKVVDECLNEIIEAVDNNFYKLIVTADHGNCDEMLNESGEIITTHSVNPVPFIIRDKHVNLKHKGTIASIAPTILKYMDIAIPKEMKETKTLFVEED